MVVVVVVHLEYLGETYHAKEFVNIQSDVVLDEQVQKTEASHQVYMLEEFGFVVVVNVVATMDVRNKAVEHLRSLE